MNVHFSSATVEWSTPQWLFDALNQRFEFTIDPCCTHENAKCQIHFTKFEDGLSYSWRGERVWMNPPYGRTIADWCKKAQEEADDGALVVGLLPARPGPSWWHKYVQGHADIHFLQGRLKFGGAETSAPFDSAIAIWWGKNNILGGKK